jgi:hypothetical protein
LSHATILCTKAVHEENPFLTLIKNKIKIFIIYEEIQNGAVAKSIMRKGFQIYEEMRKYLAMYMRPLVKYDFVAAPF